MAVTVPYEQIRERNAAFIDNLESKDPGLTKKADTAANSFVRMKVREDCVFDKILEPQNLSDSELTMSVHDDNPVKVCSREPDSPAAVSIPFAKSPMSFYIEGDRFEVKFHRIATRKFTKDVIQLRSYDMDIRQVISDNAIRDMGAEKDSKWFTAVEAALGDAADTTVTFSNAIHWKTISGGVTRENLEDGAAIMPALPGRFEAALAVCNNLFVRQIMKFGRDEAGGDISQDWLTNGWKKIRFMNMDWITSIKHDIIPNNRVYYFADQSAIGKHYSLEDYTMVVKREYFMLTWFTFGCYGATFANPNAAAIADFD